MRQRSRLKLLPTLALATALLITPGAAGAATPTAIEFSAGITPMAGPVGIAAGPDGDLWFTEFNIDKIGEIDEGGAVLNEFGTGITAGAFPRWIAAGPDGNLWFTEQVGDRIGRRPQLPARLHRDDGGLPGLGLPLLLAPLRRDRG